MTRLLLLVSLVSLVCCAHRVCGTLDAQTVYAFHQSHYLSQAADLTSVEGLAVEGFNVCVESGVATIENHPTELEAHDLDAGEWQGMPGAWP